MPHQSSYLHLIILIVVVALGAAVRFFGDPALVATLAGVSGLAFPLGMLGLMMMRKRREKEEQNRSESSENVIGED